MKMRKLYLIIVGLLLGLAVHAQSPQPYLVADFTESDLPTLLDICHQGGFGMLVEKTPFSTYGHYEWNPAFAPEGDASVRRMVNAAQAEGVTLCLWVEQDAITLNDAFFAPENFHQLQRSIPMELFDDVDEEDVELALRRNDLMSIPSSLNLLMVGDEMICIGSLEYTTEVILLHQCSRGLYGTPRTAHGLETSAYRIWDTPERFVRPEGRLREQVRQQLAERMASVGVTAALVKGDPGQGLIEESIRVRQVERWESEGVDHGSLGWLVLHGADQRRQATSIDDVEWLLAKAAAYQASYGMAIDARTLQNHGAIPEMLEQIQLWNRLIRQDAFNDYQKEMLKDPYLDWHLEMSPDSLFLVYPWNYSRRYPCELQEVDTGLLRTENWIWNVEEEDRFGLRLQVDGEVPISNPMINTSQGLVQFPCTIQPGQRLLFDFGETAYVVDANCRRIAEVPIEGLPALSKGENEVSFYCEVDPSVEQRPVVRLRYITREMPFMIRPH